MTASNHSDDGPRYGFRCWAEEVGLRRETSRCNHFSNVHIMERSIRRRIMENFINAKPMNPTKKEGFRCGINGEKWCWVTSGYGTNSNNQNWYFRSTHLRENGSKKIN